MYDLLIKNGQIFDGTGSGPFFADVAAVNGDIVAIGSLEGESAKTVDAAGLAVYFLWGRKRAGAALAG